MRIGVVLSPVPAWPVVRAAAVAADELGFDSVGLWDHYHSARPEFAYVAGWSAHSALAEATNTIHITPSVLNGLHYELGVLAKESSMLSILSGGRFELAIGAGDWPESHAAWGRPFPGRDERLQRLAETVALLREIWRGEVVNHSGRYESLAEVACTPSPNPAPRVVIGAGSSRSLIDAAASYADEINVYAEERLVQYAIAALGRLDRKVDLSVLVSWEWDKWPAEAIDKLQAWEGPGIDRVWVNIGSFEMVDRLETLRPLLK